MAKINVYNISDQVLPLDGGLMLLQKQSFVTDRSPQLDNYERNGMVLLTPDTATAREKTVKETQPEQDDPNNVVSEINPSKRISSTETQNLVNDGTAPASVTRIPKATS